MNQQQANKIMTSMIDFIRSNGKERVDEIRHQTKTDFNVQLERMIDAEKKRLTSQYEKDLNIAEINLKIERSAEQNKQRIERMKIINELVESIKTDAKVSLATRMQEDSDAYGELLKKLLVQGLIKLIEPKVTLRCREGDVDLLEGVVEDAVAEYKELMLSQVKALEGKEDIPCNVTVDKENFLPDYNPEDPTNSCIGGFVMYAKRNRIVCSQKLDDRIQLTYQMAIPEMRASLFPSLVQGSKH